MHFFEEPLSADTLIKHQSIRWPVDAREAPAGGLNRWDQWAHVGLSDA
jgi:hypothetical protein